MRVEDGEHLHFGGFAGIAIGWLERHHPYEIGITPQSAVERLAKILDNPVWASFAMGYHHCDLGVCGIRLGTRSLLARIPVQNSFESLGDELVRQVTNVREREVSVRRTVARHNRRHHVPDLQSRPCASHYQELLLLRLKLWATRPVDALALVARYSINVFSTLVDPHPYQERWGKTHINVGASNLLIPAAAKVYFAPSMVLHYISKHHYRPPDAFCDAVLRCPPIGTRAYFEALRPAVTTVDFGTWVDGQLEFVRRIESSRTNVNQ